MSAFLDAAWHLAPWLAVIATILAVLCHLERPRRFDPDAECVEYAASEYGQRVRTRATGRWSR